MVFSILTEKKFPNRHSKAAFLRFFSYDTGVVYFTLGNIDPKHRSQTNAIQLLAIATTPIIKKYGICALLEPFMEDLEKLEKVVLIKFQPIRLM